MGSEATNPSDPSALERLRVPAERNDGETDKVNNSAKSQSGGSHNSPGNDGDGNPHLPRRSNDPLDTHDMTVSGHSTSSSSVDLLYSPIVEGKSHDSIGALMVGGYSTPPGVGSNRKHIVPNSAPCNFYREGSLQLKQMLKGKLKPPFLNSSEHSANSATTDYNLLTESAHRGFNGYGRPDEFVSPTGNGKRRSWRPKDTSSDHKPGTKSPISPKRDKMSRVSYPAFLANHVRPPLVVGHRSSSHSTSSNDLSPGARGPQSLCSSPMAGGGEFHTPENGGGRPKVRKLPIAVPPLAAEDGFEAQLSHRARSPKRESAPDPSSMRKAVQGFSPVSAANGRKKWASRRVTDLSELPPAFRAAHRASNHSVSGSAACSPLSPKGRSIDIGALERVVPRAREKLIPRKLNRKWPPVTISADDEKKANRLSFLTALNAATDSMVVKRRHFFDHDEDLQSQPSISRTLTAVDLAIQVVRGQNLHEMSGRVLPQGLFAEKVHAILNNTVESTSESDGDDSSEVYTSETSIDQATTRGELLSKVRTSMKIRWGGPTYYTIEGRPLYYEGTYFDENDDELPFAPLLEDRFGAGGASNGLQAPHRSRDSSNAPPSCPRRTYDDWSDEESWFSDDGEEMQDGDAKSTSQQNSENLDSDTAHCPRPVVWVVPMAGDEVAENDETWRVRRVWDEPAIDAFEPEHLVHNDRLMDKVKELLGVPAAFVVSNASPDYNPGANQWCMKKVYDIEGEIHQESKTMKVDESGMLGGFDEVAKAAAGTTYNAVTKLDPKEDQTADALIVDSVVAALPEVQPKGGEVDMELGNEASLSIGLEREVSPAIVSEAQPLQVKISEKPKRASKKGRRSKRDEMTLWDLLSPPPVCFISEDG